MKSRAAEMRVGLFGLAILGFVGTLSAQSVATVGELLAAVTPEESLDRSARLHGFARVWTPVPGCSGTSSLAIEPGRFRSSFHGATGLRVDAGHRGNFGLVNPNSRPRTFKVSPNSPPVEVSVPPASMRQWPIPTANESGAPVEIFVGIDGGGVFAGYATSVDQFSGDGWLVNFGPPE